MDQGHKNTDKILENLEKELKSIYYKSYKENKTKLDKVSDLIAEYSKDLTEADRIKL